MRLAPVLLLLGLIVRFAEAQEARKPFDPNHEWNIFGEYSNDSSQILLGQSRDRHLAAFGASYSLRLKTNRIASWRWQFEAVPVVFVSNPRLTTVENFTVSEPPIQGQFTTVTEVLPLNNCKSGSGVGPILTGSGAVIGSYTFTNTCTHPVTYGGGMSPLGQRINFFPRRSLQPYFAANAGFLVFTTSVPTIGATAFNFDFEFAMGLEWYRRPGHAWSVDYRYHHISNAYTGNENPGIDNGTFRLAYCFGR
jgi:hypothetical protein